MTSSQRRLGILGWQVQLVAPWGAPRTGPTCSPALAIARARAARRALQGTSVRRRILLSPGNKSATSVTTNGSASMDPPAATTSPAARRAATRWASSPRRGQRVPVAADLALCRRQRAAHQAERDLGEAASSLRAAGGRWTTSGGSARVAIRGPACLAADVHGPRALRQTRQQPYCRYRAKTLAAQGKREQLVHRGELGVVGVCADAAGTDAICG